MLSLEDVEAARATLDGVVHHTPVEPSATFSELVGAEVYLKLENLQRTGSFKVRGAYNKIMNLPEAERARGVVAASAGNHAQGVAFAARAAGIPCTIVMPRNAPISKAQAVQGYGADLVLHGRDYQEAYERALEAREETGAVFVHAFNDEAIMAGQGTVGLEVLEDVPDVDRVVVGVGGGGLIAGVATAIKAKRPDVSVVGAQAAGAASLPQSLKAGRVLSLDAVETIADGLAARAVGDQTFDVIRERVDDVAVVDDDEIASAILMLLERAKTVSEGAGAAALAALLSGKVPVAEGEKVVAVVSGGNIDVTLLDNIIRRGLSTSGRSLRLTTVLADKPGALRDLLTLLADERANIREIQHDRGRADVSVGKTAVELTLDTRGPGHVEEILQALAAAGYPVTRHQP